MTCSISLPLEVREAVLRQLKDIDGKITARRMWLYEMGAIDLYLNHFFLKYAKDLCIIVLRRIV